jgi:hypothetical protein
MDARRLATPFLIGLALLAFTSPAYAHQPAINVACGDIPGLRAAIAAANDAAQHPGDDTIALGQSCTYDVTDEHAAETSEAGHMHHQDPGNGSNIERTVTDRFRLFNVGATGLLLIDDLTLRMGILAPGGVPGRNRLPRELPDRLARARSAGLLRRADEDDEARNR